MDGPVYSPRLLNTREEIWISQLLADGGVLGAEMVWGNGLWKLDLSEPARGPEKVRDIPWTDSSLSVSPNGEMVAFATSRNGPEQIWVSKLDGSTPRVLVPAIPPYGEYGDNTNASSLSWSPDGQWIAFLTDPGVGHATLRPVYSWFPRQVGHFECWWSYVRTTVARCLWAADSKSVFVAQEDDSDGKENFEMKYFQADMSARQANCGLRR